MMFRLVTLLCFMTLVGCASVTSSITPNRDKQYLSAQSIPPLRVPPNVSPVEFQNTYPVPDRQYPAQSKTISIVPPGLYS